MVEGGGQNNVLRLTKKKETKTGPHFLSRHTWITLFKRSRSESETKPSDKIIPDALFSQVSCRETIRSSYGVVKLDNIVPYTVLD